MKKCMFPLVIVFMFFVAQTGFAAGALKIGVLAKNGPVKALKMWGATGKYLTEKVGTPFEIVPLDFNAVFPAIEAGNVEFFLVNSSMFVTAKAKYGASAIATMINSRQGKPLKAFGGVILTSDENEDINSLADLKGKTFAAVSKSSFGGWQMAYMELLNQGIDPFSDFTEVQFAGKHDNVVLAIQNGAADAGTVRTDTMERMQAGGIIDMEDFKILNAQSHSGFPFVCSTPLYPEWPLAKISAVSDDMATKVLAALKDIKETDPAAKDAKIVGWTDALDYQGVEDLQRALKIGAYQE